MSTFIQITFLLHSLMTYNNHIPPHQKTTNNKKRKEKENEITKMKIERRRRGRTEVGRFSATLFDSDNHAFHRKTISNRQILPLISAPLQSNRLLSKHPAEIGSDFMVSVFWRWFICFFLLWCVNMSKRMTNWNMLILVKEWENGRLRFFIMMC